MLFDAAIDGCDSFLVFESIYVQTAITESLTIMMKNRVSASIFANFKKKIRYKTKCQIIKFMHNFLNQIQIFRVNG